MRSKQLIRFYFGADALNRKLDDLILKRACAAFDKDAERAAESIIEIIGVKAELQGLWGYLDGAMGGLSAGEREVLRLYGGLRVGIGRLPCGSAREIRRVTVKLVRRLRGIGRFEGAVRLLGRFYCLL